MTTRFIPATLSNSRVIVTGATSGIGLATARRFAEEGASVAILARRMDILSQLAAELGDRVYPLETDVADPAAATRAVRRSEELMGGIDIVVNSAGVGFPSPLETVTPDLWANVIAINLSGSFFVAREAGLRMRAAGSGVIINIGSELSSMGVSTFVPYCASKFGVIGLTKALAAELAPTVRVNVVCPGPIDTPMTDAELNWYPDPDRARHEATERVPLKRFASPDEVVAAIRYLAIDAPFATGAVLPLDGGTTIA